MGINGKGGAQGVLYGSLLFNIIDLAVTVVVLLLLVTLPDKDDFEKEHQKDSQHKHELSPEEKDRFKRITSHARVVFIFLLVIQLTTIALRSYATWALWQSTEKCETNPEEAAKSLDMARYTIMGICVVDLLSLIFIPGSILQLTFLVCCLNEYQTGLQNEICRRQMYGGANGAIPTIMPMMPMPGYGYAANGPAAWQVDTNAVYSMPILPSSAPSSELGDVPLSFEMKNGVKN